VRSTWPQRISPKPRRAVRLQELTVTLVSSPLVHTAGPCALARLWLVVGAETCYKLNRFSLAGFRLRRPRTASTRILYSELQRPRAGTVLERESGTVPQQRVHRSRTTLADCSVQRSDTPLVRRVWIGARRSQQDNHFGLRLRVPAAQCGSALGCVVHRFCFALAPRLISRSAVAFH